MQSYYVYLVRCADQTFYTGICTDLDRRLAEHNSSTRGARYTRGRQPVAYVYQEVCGDRSEAQQREYLLRHLSHKEKEVLTREWFNKTTPPDSAGQG